MLNGTIGQTNCGGWSLTALGVDRHVIDDVLSIVPYLLLLLQQCCLSLSIRSSERDCPTIPCGLAVFSLCLFTKITVKVPDLGLCASNYLSMTHENLQRAAAVSFGPLLLEKGIGSPFGLKDISQGSMMADTISRAMKIRYV